MAGIGFELRKIYRKKTLSSAIAGSFYATVSTIGPAVLFSGMILLLDMVFDWINADILVSEFFVTSFSTLCLISLLTSAAITAVLSRFISDCIFKGENGKISASIMGVLLLTAAVSGIVSAILAVCMMIFMHVPAALALMYYLTCTGIACTYTVMTYISAIKEYKKITLAYLIGTAAVLLVFGILHFLLRQGLCLSLYTGLAFGFWLMNLLMVRQCLKSFGAPYGQAFEFIQYFKKYPFLMIGGFAYMLGIFIPNLIYWMLLPGHEVIGIFCAAPAYDSAMFLSVLVTMPAIVMFTVKTETTFADQYKTYLSALNTASYEQIELEHQQLIRTMSNDYFTVCEVQLILTVVLICLMNVLFPYLGMNTEILQTFSLLGLGMYCIFSMYFTVVFLYYFEDYTYSLYGPVICCCIGLIGSLICAVWFPLWTAMPVLIGGLASWLISFYLLKKRVDGLNAFLMCKSNK